MPLTDAGDVSVLLFGSVATGEATENSDIENSDINLVVVMDDLGDYSRTSEG